MKAAVWHKVGDPLSVESVSVQEDVPIPEPQKGELLIKVYAAAINPIDWKLVRGDLPNAVGRIGCDVSGVVEKIGPETAEMTSLKVGDAMYADAFQTKGAFGEYCLVQTNAASKKPQNVSFVEAASLPLAGLTALQGLVHYLMLKPGQKVLIFGGSGGVGSLAVQFCKALGAGEVTATGSNVSLIKDLGADVVVNYKEESLMEALKGKDFDLVYDTIGGFEHYEVAQAAMNKHGRFLSTVGDDADAIKWTFAKALFRYVMGRVGLWNYYALCIADTSSDRVQGDMAQMTELVEAGKVKPLLDERRFELTPQGLKEFIEASMSHRAKGKLVMVVRKE